MADYERFTLRGVFSANSDYSSPKHDTEEVSITATPDHIMEGEVSVATLGTDVVPADLYLTGDTVFVQNLDTANFVTVTVKDNGGTSISVDVPAEGVFLLSGWTPDAAVHIVADTAACQVYFWASGTY